MAKKAYNYIKETPIKLSVNFSTEILQEERVAQYNLSDKGKLQPRIVCYEAMFNLMVRSKSFQIII